MFMVQIAFKYSKGFRNVHWSTSSSLLSSRCKVVFLSYTLIKTKRKSVWTLFRASHMHTTVSLASVECFA